MEYKNNIPIYIQVIQDIKRKILTKELALGQKLPSSRELSLIYEINPNTAARIYNELEGIGFTFTKRGIGTFVSEDVAILDKIKQELVYEYLAELTDNLEKIGYHKKEIIKLLEEYYKE